MIDTAALREKVLDLAIRGKLVPQDPNDEPASVLLERIHEQKLQMVREGKLKAKDVKDDTIIFKGDDNCYYEKYSDGTIKNIQDEIPFDLPVGWAWSRISSFSIINPRNSLSNELEVSFIPMPLISEGYKNEHSFEIKEWKNVKTGFTHFAEGDIGVAKITPCFENKKSVVFNGLQNGFGAGTTELHIIRVFSKAINAKYVLWNLKTNAFIADGINAFSGAVGQKRISKEFIADYLLPIPSIQQQNKIVNVVDDCFRSIDAIENSSNSLDNIKALLKSKILELAIQGKLVPQNENDEPASVLLERIRAERKANLGKKYVESYIFKGDDNCYYENVGSKTKNITDEIPFDIPNSWSWIRLSNITTLITKGTTPRGDAYTYTNSGIGFLRAENIVGFDRISKKDLKYINETTHYNFLKRSILEENDILITIAGTLGRTGMVTKEDLPLNANQAVSIVRVVNGYKIDLLYLIFVLNAPIIKKYLLSKSVEMAIPNLSLENISDCVIPLPPIQEQYNITKKISQLLDILKGGD